MYLRLRRVRLQSSEKQPILIALDAWVLSVGATFKLSAAMPDMATATKVIARHVGFDFGIAAGGELIGNADSAGAVALVAVVPALILLPRTAREHRTQAMGSEVTVPP